MTTFDALYTFLAAVWWSLVAWYGFRAVRGLVRFCKASSEAKRNYWLVFKIWVRWRKLTLALDLATVERETTTIHSRPSLMPFSKALGLTVGSSKTHRRIRYPKVRVRADDFGAVLDVKTLPKVGRAEWEKAADYLANAWSCARVQVFQSKPGRLVVRGVRRDPLAVPLSMADAPAGVYTDPHPFRPYLGRDEWAVDRWLDLSGITGITVGGLPRYGKTSLILSLLMQLGGSRAVQFVFLDGKGSGRNVGADYEDWTGRAWMASGDDLDRAEEILTTLNDHMMERGRVIRDVLGVKNGWHVGPSPEWPLIVLVVDECHTFFDDKQAATSDERKRYLRLQSLAAALPRKAGSVMMLGIFLTQKQTGDAIPTAIRDNCTIGLSFAVKTRDAAAAALGDGIRSWPSLCPTTLRERPTYIGTCTAALPDGSAEFIRLRVPYVTDSAAGLQSALTSDRRTDPDELLAALTVRAQPSTVPVNSADHL